jgi:dTDP-4-dehydrorhamnose reductase
VGEKTLLMKILLLGGNGQIGRELRHSLMSLGQIKSCGRDMADFRDLDGLQYIIRDYVPDVIVNAVAYTAVDKAEHQKDKAYSVNYKAVSFLAKEAKRLDAWLIHYSSDYVFNGKKLGAYTEMDKANPLSVYGDSKLMGDKEIVKSNCKYIIFRTSWVYSVYGDNFIRTIRRLGKERKSIKVVSDQIGAPTSAKLIANISALCLYRLFNDHKFTKKYSGIYNLSSTGKVSWHGLAKYVIKESKQMGDNFLVNCENIHPVKASEYQSIATRPNNSLLNTRKICSVFGVYLPHWKVALNEALKELYLQKV